MLCLNRYVRIATHARPDGDEFFAIWLLRYFQKEAELKYPGSSTAPIVCFTADLLPDGKSEKDFLETLFIGCGKGELDEHPRKDPNQCAATRVATKLGVRNYKGLARLIRITLEEDRKRAKVQNSFGDALKLVSHRWIKDPTKAFEWAMVAYNAIFFHDNEAARHGRLNPDHHLTIREVLDMIADNVGQENARKWESFLVEASQWREGVKREARVIWKKTSRYSYMLPDGRHITLGVIKHENHQLNFIGWNELQVGVFIQKAGDNVQIYTMQSLGLCLRKTAQIIRTKEMTQRGITPIPQATVLRATDTLKECPQWHLVNTSTPNKPILFNGNQVTADGVEPTALTLDEIVFAVIEGLEMIPSDQARNLVKVKDAIPAP